MTHPSITLPDPARPRHALAGVVLAAAVLSSGAAHADQPPSGRRGPIYRNPEGSVLLTGGLGVGVSRGVDTSTRFVGTVGVGYAVLTGVVPGLRGQFSSTGGQLGGEITADLTLTPPLSMYVLPFVLAEIGASFDSLGTARVLGAGGGIYIGEPQASFSLQVGWIFRQLQYSSDVLFTAGAQRTNTLDASGPLVALSFRL